MELLLRPENVSERGQGETRMSARILSRAAWMSESWIMTVEQSSYSASSQPASSPLRPRRDRSSSRSDGADGSGHRNNRADRERFQISIDAGRRFAAFGDCPYDERLAATHVSRSEHSWN